MDKLYKVYCKVEIQMYQNNGVLVLNSFNTFNNFVK